MQKIVENSKKIFDLNGEINFGGWSKSALFEYNRENYPAENKLCESDSYFISNGEMGFYISSEISGIDLSIKIILADYKTGEVVTDSISKRLLLEQIKLPISDTVGEFSYRDKKIAMTVTNTVDGKYLKCDFIDFGNIKNLFVKLFLKSGNGDSMNMVSPFEKDKNCFYYKRFVEDYTASGVVRFGGYDYDLTEDNSLVYFAKCRYSLSRHRKFQILCGTCDIDGHRLSINLASKVGNNRNGSENCYFVDGKLYKIGRTKVSGDDKNPVGKWEFSTADNNLDLVFTPKEVGGKILACKCDKVTIIFGNLNGTLETEQFKINLKDKNFHMIFTSL
ncbi:MAG: DUF2804 family protein [Ruminococcus sp.]|nr:DUF2804 family protein [Ruminococcus sp.]